MMLRAARDRVRGMVAAWDVPTRVGLVLALAVLVAALVAAAVGPMASRAWALAALTAAVFAAQGLVLWGNRGLVSTFTLAQRAFRTADFDQVVALLEPLYARGRLDGRGLTLLGNAHRQRGDVAASEAILRTALDAAPTHHFPRYGYGRTLLVTGRYAAAAAAFAQALQQGAPPAVAVDEAEARWRAGDVAGARAALGTLGRARVDGPRALVLALVRDAVDGGTALTPNEPLVVQWGPVLAQDAVRWAALPYGRALAAELAALGVPLPTGARITVEDEMGHT